VTATNSPDDLKDTDKMRAYVLAFVQKELTHVWWGKYVDPSLIITLLFSAMRQDAHKGQVDPLEELRMAPPDAIAQLLSREQLEQANALASQTGVMNAGVALPGRGGPRRRQ
jgi:hypothetical protein